MASYILGAADGDNLGREQGGERLERTDKEVSLLPTPVSFFPPPLSTSSHPRPFTRRHSPQQGQEARCEMNERRSVGRRFTLR